MHINIMEVEPQKDELWVSCDVETDGPIPGPHSMLSLGACALTDKAMLGTFSANLETLPDASGHPETMKWWSTQPQAWAACRVAPEDPLRVMTAFAGWLNELARIHRGKPIFVAYPAGFDFTFVYWYLMRFAGHSPFGFSAIDMKTVAMLLLREGKYRDATKRNFPKHWFPPSASHTHVAVEDAIEQGLMFREMMKDHAKDNDARYMDGT